MSKITDLFKKKENQGERKSEKALASFSHWVMTHKTIIISIFAVLMILAVVGNFFVHKQSDVISYLDNDTATKQGLANLQKEYNIIGDFSMGISYLSEEQMTELISKIQSSLDTKVEEVVDEDGEYVLDENGEIVTSTLYRFVETGTSLEGRVLGELEKVEKLKNTEKLRLAGLSPAEL